MVPSYRVLHGWHLAAAHLKVTMLQVHAEFGKVLFCFAPPDITLLRQHQTAEAQLQPISPGLAALKQQADSQAPERICRR